jgi:protein-tyrosine phosphatase
MWCGHQAQEAAPLRRARVTSKRVRVLFVCLGNICRSPTAEAVCTTLATREWPHLALSADSAGTANYHIGRPPDPRSSAVAKQRGYDLSGLRARTVSAADFNTFDLLVAMDLQNLAELQQRHPDAATAKIKLLLPFAPQLQLEEVPDPYYGTESDFVQVLDLIEAGVRGLLTHLAERR